VRRPRLVLGSDLSRAPRSGLFGCVEVINGVGIRGWLLDAGNLGNRVGVAVMLDGVRIFSGKGATLRPDVSDLLAQHAYCGFEFKWRDVLPDRALPAAGERAGDLRVVTPGDEMLPLACTFSSTDVYAKVEYYTQRLALVLGQSSVADPSPLDDLMLVAQAFDVAFYTAMYPASREHEAGALDHFMTKGWREGLDPSAEFSSSYYVANNADVASAGINPLVHYLRAGRAEGRMPRPVGGWRMDTLRELRSIEQIVNLWRRKETLRCLTAGNLQQKLEAHAAHTAPKRLVLSFSHDDYTRNVGGIQLCLAKEQEAYNAAGAMYLHISPWQPLPTLAPNGTGERLALRVICDGKEIGNALGSDLVAVVSRLVATLGRAAPVLTIHALHGHSPEVIALFHRALPGVQPFFWVHDWFSVCSGYNLLRNNVQFCGAPPQDSTACGLCVHGEQRPPHMARVQALFEAVPFVVVAPSQDAATLWSRTSRLPHRKLVAHPHCTVEEEGQRLAVELLLPAGDGEDGSDNAPVRVAFLGHPNLHKGWPLFRDLVRRLCSDARYEFWHLGSAGNEGLPLRFREVKVSPANPRAMVEALSEEAIDVVVQWSVWPETFGITARECQAAGVAMVVADASGAVAAHVRETHNGWVLGEEAELAQLFLGEAVVEEIERRRREGTAVGTLRWSRLTGDLHDAAVEG
jgi:hypothetical protein